MSLAMTVGDPPTKQFFQPAMYTSTKGDFPAANVPTSGSINLIFVVPHDFTSLVSIVAVVIPEGTNGAADIDLTSNYASFEEGYETHSEADAASTYALVQDQIGGIDLSSVFSSLAAGDVCGVHVDHTGVGFLTKYLGTLITYA